MAERAVVVRKTRVRFSPSTLLKMVKILFICKYNAFRSRISEEYFNKISKNNNVGIISRGIIMGGDSDKEQRRLAKQILGINIAKRKPLPLRLQEMIDADKIIVVANDVPRIIFNYKIVNLQKKVIIWRIKDEQKMNQKNIKKIILKIKKKVDELNKELEKRK